MAEPAHRDAHLTADDIAHRLAAIHGASDDPETAHMLADGLYVEVLTAIAAGAPDAPLLAAAALRAESIEFDRWYA
ncbi:hypothetical protein AB0B42_00630 [Streptomyces fradiae]|uniref:hypothetical protein n=1 Tax=Streptomyces fradiae TaxID=1906 RepID=UPI0033C13A6F